MRARRRAGAEAVASRAWRVRLHVVAGQVARFHLERLTTERHNVVGGGRRKKKEKGSPALSKIAGTVPTGGEASTRGTISGDCNAVGACVFGRLVAWEGMQRFFPAAQHGCVLVLWGRVRLGTEARRGGRRRSSARRGLLHQRQERVSHLPQVYFPSITQNRVCYVCSSARCPQPGREIGIVYYIHRPSLNSMAGRACCVAHVRKYNMCMHV